MYVPKAFAETRPEVLHDIVRHYPLGTLVVVSAAGLDANHLPFIFDESSGSSGLLSGHVARANPVWQSLSATSEVLVVFQGPQAYVSPSAYESKLRDGKVVPTWNYIAVHAYGYARAVQDQAWLMRLVERLTVAHESQRSHPWQVSDAPADYISKLLDHIVGIEISITRLLGKRKLSQNRPAADRSGVIADLANNARTMSEAMTLLELEPGNPGDPL